MGIWYLIISCVILIIWGCVFFGTLSRYTKNQIFRTIVWNLGLFFLAIATSKLISILL